MASPERIPTLDGWRALAISAVLLSHGFLLADSVTGSDRLVRYVAGCLGGLGVALFFAISGYLITTLLLREHAEAGRISLRGFYIRRAFRILPPAYIYLMTLVILRKPLQSGELASAALFFSNYWEHRSWWTQHFWSLSMEEHFYLLWPAVLAVFGSARALWLAGMAICAILVWRPWSLAHVILPFPDLQRTDMRLDAFLFAGALAIILYSDGRRAIQATSMLTSNSFRFVGSIALAVASVWPLSGPARAMATLAQSVLLPTLMVSVILGAGSPISRFLEAAPIRWIGRISYGLYLWQQLFLVSHVAPTFGAAATVFLPHLATIIAIATLSYYLMERPLLSYGRTLSARLTRIPTAPAIARAKQTSA